MPANAAIGRRLMTSMADCFSTGAAVARGRDEPFTWRQAKNGGNIARPIAESALDASDAVLALMPIARKTPTDLW